MPVQSAVPSGAQIAAKAGYIGWPRSLGIESRDLIGGSFQRCKAIVMAVHELHDALRPGVGRAGHDINQDKRRRIDQSFDHCTECCHAAHRGTNQSDWLRLSFENVNQVLRQRFK